MPLEIVRPPNGGTEKTPGAAPDGQAYDQAPAPAPDGLGPSGTRLWDAVILRHLDVHEELLLLHACRTADLLDRLNEQITNEALTLGKQRGGKVTNPAVAEHRQQSLVFARLLASLRIPSTEGGTRPQRRGGARVPYGYRRQA
ncbi:hypothetical protein ACFYRC_05985 [Streptomyces sp. NPDC005279]|uniref:hypothetical protein n=1 Tax=Streptomyces sp. NPDC005279 TaxID=3364712 RepID=UPI00369807FA